MRIFALLLVMVAFTWLVAWVCLPSNRARFERYGSQILESDDAEDHA